MEFVDLLLTTLRTQSRAVNIPVPETSFDLLQDFLREAHTRFPRLTEPVVMVFFSGQMRVIYSYAKEDFIFVVADGQIGPSCRCKDPSCRGDNKTKMSASSAEALEELTKFMRAVVS